MKKTLTPAVQFFKWGQMLMLVAGICSSGQAADYLGADAVLKQVAERNAQSGKKDDGDVQAKFREELKAFSLTVTNLAPAEAAKGWLDLADRVEKVQRLAMLHYVPDSQPIAAADLLGALPPPAAWSELAKAITNRPPAKDEGDLRELGLRFLAATLTSDTEGQNREIARLATKSKDANYQTSYLYRNYLEQISRTMLAMSDNPEVVLQSLTRQLDAAPVRGVQSLEIPNLVAQVGAEKAGAFLRRALVTPNVTLQFGQPNETSRLAQKLALELIDQLKMPQWGLINSVDAVALYEAMDKRFAVATNAVAPAPGLPNLPPNLPDADLGTGMGDMQKAGAQIYYLLGLISQDRTKDAVVVAKKMHGQNTEYLFDNAFKAMQHAGYTEALDNFFNELLSQDPSLPFWDQYVEVAAQAGQTERMLAAVRAALANVDLNDGKKAALHQILFKALLAADNSDEAVQEMRHMMTLPDTERSPEDYNAGQLGLLLARIGMLLQKPEWTDEGIVAAKKWLATPAGRNFSGGNADEVSITLAEILSDLQRGPEAEAVLTEALTAATAQSGSRTGYEWNGSPAQHLLTELAALYHRAGRPQDVLDLLQNSPDWSAGDVSGLFSAMPGESMVTLMWLHTGVSPLPVPYLAANALLATGQKEAAEKINDALLNRFPGLDRGYELLLAINGTNAIPKLDELFKRDQFEERPLIWKAHLLREQGQLEAAERLLRQAINIDPSDGEEGRGDRMRVYAELADVREARGDKKEADFFREVVKSIRMSEQADQFYSAGLLKRAVAMYEEALKHFSDAYCIQSRLAIQLAALGMTEEAEAHYRRAYELMPDSFGRVESHCFGCERVFDGEKAQSIAEKTFTKLAEERPDKPQIHYLLGYLHQEEAHYNEARTNYLAAVRLDPDYLNAWVKLQEVSQQVLVSPKERDAITFNILRLDPLKRHAQPDFRNVSNLAELWNAVAVAAAQQPVVSTNLLALPASKLALEKKQKNTPDLYYYTQQASQERLSPAQAVSETPFVNLAGEMILNNGQMDE